MNNFEPVEPTSLANFVTVDPTLKPMCCASHGDYDSRNIIGRVWSGCPQCASNEAAIRAKEEAEKEAVDRHKRWMRKLGEACIPERFQTRTLATYQAVSEGQKRALAFATAYADQFDDVSKSGRCAIFCGKPGTGKTHLAVGIALQIMLRGKLGLFTTVQRMVRNMKETFRKDSEYSERDIMGFLVEPDLLIIDEIGVQFGTEFERNFMFDILNERYEKRRPTLLLSNLTAPEVKAFLGERVYDRLREDGGQCVPFDWASHRGGAT